MADFPTDLPPELLAQLMGLSTVPDEMALVDEQLARAKALRQAGLRFTTPGAAGVQALGNLARGGISLAQENDLSAQKRALIDQLRSGRLSFAEEEMRQAMPSDFSEVPDVEESVPIQAPPQMTAKKKRRPQLGTVSGY